MVQHRNDTHSVIGTLRRSAAALDQIVEELDSGDVQKPPKEARGQPRLPFRPMLKAEVSHPGGSKVTTVVRARNLSASGLAFVHVGYIHRGTRCVVHLPQRGGGTIAVRGEIVRCSHVRGVIHDFGLQFEAQIDVTPFVVAEAA